MEPLKRDPGRTLWAQIADTLAEDIALGGLAPGVQLPTEHQLAERFSVNRHTVRRALQEMEQAGLIRVERGRGTFVEDGVININLGRRTRFSESVGARSAIRSQELLRAYELPARPDMARVLNIKKGATLVCLETRGVINRRPVSLGHHFFPTRLFPDMADRFRDLRSITRCLKSYGIDDYTRAKTTVSAVMPTAEQAHALQQPRTRPVLRTDWHNIDVDGRPIECGHTLNAGDRVQVTVTPETH